MAEGLKTINPSLGRFKNSLLDFSDIIYQGILPQLKAGLESARNIIDSVNLFIRPIFKVVRAFANFVGFLPELITAVIYDLFNLPQIIKRFTENQKNVTTAAAVSVQQPQKLQAELSIKQTEESKKELEIRMDKKITGLWQDFNMNLD